MTTIPVIEIYFDATFTKENVVSILKRAQSLNCLFYHLVDKKVDTDNKNQLNLEEAVEYLGALASKKTNDRSILIKKNGQCLTLSLYDCGNSELTLRLSSIENKNDITSYILFLMDISQDLPIFSMNTITDGSKCEWHYGQEAANNKIKTESSGN